VRSGVRGWEGWYLGLFLKQKPEFQPIGGGFLGVGSHFIVGVWLEYGFWAVHELLHFQIFFDNAPCLEVWPPGRCQNPGAFPGRGA
jgi:hypothetical protein